LGASAYLKNLLYYIDRAADRLLDDDFVQSFRENMGMAGVSGISIALVRSILRHMLQPLRERGFVPPLDVVSALHMVFDVLFSIRALHLGVLRGGLPIVLTPPSTMQPQPLNESLYMRLAREGDGWILLSVPDESVRFSFDLPPELFLRFAASGSFNPAPDDDALWLHVIDLFDTTEERHRVVKIWLQRRWESDVIEWATKVPVVSEADEVAVEF
jgi:hypothetical protein